MDPRDKRDNGVVPSVRRRGRRLKKLGDSMVERLGEKVGKKQLVQILEVFGETINRRTRDAGRGTSLFDTSWRMRRMVGSPPNQSGDGHRITVLFHGIDFSRRTGFLLGQCRVLR